MAKSTPKPNLSPLQSLIQQNFLFRNLDEDWLSQYLSPDDLREEKLFSNRPIYTAFRPDRFIDGLYLMLGEGLVIIRSAPLDRIISISYPGSCFGMRSLPLSFGLFPQGFPSLVEAYKTTHVIKIALDPLQKLYDESEVFQQRYQLLFELRSKFQYHLLNCSTYPPQAVASLLRALIYQERELGNQPKDIGVYEFDLPVDVISRACQLNQRTVEQVLKGMQKVGLIATSKSKEISSDLVRVIDPEGLKEVYSATREKVSWWPIH